MALAMGAGAGDELDLAGGEHAHAGVFPAAGAVVERPQHPGRRQAAHLGEGGDADAELDGVPLLAALLLLGAEVVVAEHLLRPCGRGLVVAGVVLEAAHRGERELLVLDPVLLADLQRIDTYLGGELVHHPLDGVRRLRPAGAAVGVGPGLVGEHGLAAEPVGGELVDRVEHERAEHRDTPADDGDVRAEVGQQVHLESGDRAVLLGREGQLLPLVTAVVGRHQGLRPALGVLHRLAEPAGQRERHPFLRSGLQLAPKAAADVRCDHPDLRLGHTGGRREGEPHDVRDLGRRPHRDLLAGRVDHHRAGLHECRDESLLAVLPLDHDPVAAGLLDRLLDVAAGARLARVEHPKRALVRPEVRVGDDLVLCRLLEVERGRQLVVLHVDELGSVLRLGGAARDDDRDDLARERRPVQGHRRVCRRLLVWRDRPGVDHHALLVGDVLTGHDRHDIGGLFRRRGVDRGDGGVGERAAHHGHVQHPGQGEVVGPAGAAGDQSLVLLATPVPPDLGGGPLLGGGHDPAPAACCTAFTMLW